MIDLEGLASFIRIRNVVEGEIARMIHRPAHSGHIAEFVAAAIFDIKLMDNAAHKAIDGTFQSGPLVGASVNIKYGSRQKGMVNLVVSKDVAQHPDCYLVMAGPSVGAISSKGMSAPWVVEQVFVFAAKDLLQYLDGAGRRPGVATSLQSAIWNRAMIYPLATSPLLTLSNEQRQLLALFDPTRRDALS